MYLTIKSSASLAKTTSFRNGAEIINVPKRNIVDVKNTFKLTFAAPHTAYLNNVDAEYALLPGHGGTFGVKHGILAQVQRLKPGVASIQRTVNGQRVVDKWFLSSGFAFIHPDKSVNVNVIEACPLDHIDADAAAEGLRKTKEAHPTTAEEKFLHKASLEFYSALNSALHHHLKK